MTETTGINCENIQTLLCDTFGNKYPCLKDYISSVESEGELVNKSDLSEDVLRDLTRLESDWPVFEQDGENIKIYFSYKNDPNNIFVLHIIVNIAGHFDLLENFLLNYLKSNRSRLNAA